MTAVSTARGTLSRPIATSRSRPMRTGYRSSPWTTAYSIDRSPQLQAIASARASRLCSDGERSLIEAVHPAHDRVWRTLGPHPSPAPCTDGAQDVGTGQRVGDDRGCPLGLHRDLHGGAGGHEGRRERGPLA